MHAERSEVVQLLRRKKWFWPTLWASGFALAMVLAGAAIVAPFVFMFIAFAYGWPVVLESPTHRPTSRYPDSLLDLREAYPALDSNLGLKGAAG